LGYSKHQQEDPFLKRVWRGYSIRKGEREDRRQEAGGRRQEETLHI